MTRQETTFNRTTSRNQRLQTKTPIKEHVSMASKAECESFFQANVFIFTFIHFQVLWFTPLIQRCCLKVLLEKAIQSRRFSYHCQILALFLRSFALFIASDGITDFSIAQAKHCNLVFCSFVLRIDWSKFFLTDHAITCGVNGFNRAHTNATPKIPRTVPKYP